jgi:Ca-activated chloride channel family protein
MQKGITAFAVMLVVSLAGCRDHSAPANIGRTAEAPSRSDRAIDEALASDTQAGPREGLAAVIAIDVSGSMNDRVTGEDGRRARKIDVARRAARDLVEQFAAYADAHPNEPVLLAVYEFSRRDDSPDARAVMPMGPPDRAQAEAALSKLDPDGGTPIGQAMIAAKRELDATGLSRRHLLIVSDGENTDGVRPEQVAAAIGRRPDAERPSIYFVAFDVEARRFTALRDAGGLVLSAANGKELNDTLDMLLTGKILIER